jgi:prolipoprotein diacylglyceryltransferase
MRVPAAIPIEVVAPTSRQGVGWSGGCAILGALILFAIVGLLVMRSCGR